MPKKRLMIQFDNILLFWMPAHVVLAQVYKIISGRGVVLGKMTLCYTKININQLEHVFCAEWTQKSVGYILIEKRLNFLTKNLKEFYKLCRSQRGHHITCNAKYQCFNESGKDFTRTQKFQGNIYLKPEESP